MLDPAKMVCGNCLHSGRSKCKGLECWRQPPGAVAVPVSGPPVIAGGPPGLQWLVKAFRPPVDENETCGEFEPKASIGN